jgi:hypothetical protein
MTGEMTSLKQALQRDEEISSGPQGIKASFSHSLPHLIHLTRNLFIPSPYTHFEILPFTVLQARFTSSRYPRQGPRFQDKDWNRDFRKTLSERESMDYAKGGCLKII